MKKNKCSICNNEIREERQFAHIKMGEEFVLIAAEELEHLELMQEEMVKNREDFEESFVDEEKKESIYVYGVVIPQANTEKSYEEWRKFLKERMGYAYLTLEDKKQYISVIEDIKIFSEENCYGHYPCIVKLKTDINFNEKTDYGFGHVFTLKYQDMLSLESILNRDYCLCLRDLKETPGFENVNENMLKQVAREIF